MYVTSRLGRLSSKQLKKCGSDSSITSAFYIRRGDIDLRLGTLTRFICGSYTWSTMHVNSTDLRGELRMSPLIFGIGNPILDVVLEADHEFLAKYELVENTAVLIGPAQKEIFNNLSLPDRPDIFYTPGGTVQNAIRAAQRLLPKGSTAFVGCVGNDKASQFLRVASERDGVRTEYQVDRFVSTARAVVIITGKNRTICADLSAASLYSISHLRDPKIWALVESASLFYTDAFFADKGMECINAIIEHVNQKSKIFAFNLSAVFVVEQMYKQLVQIIKNSSVVFGNSDEARAFSKMAGWNYTKIEDIATSIANLPKTPNVVSSGRTVVITDGAGSTVAYDPKTSSTVSLPAASIAPSKIIDTTGAGDAFAGGFLSQFVNSKSLDVCIKGGTFMAFLVIQNVGAVYGDAHPVFHVKS